MLVTNTLSTGLILRRNPGTRGTTVPRLHWQCWDWFFPFLFKVLSVFVLFFILTHIFLNRTEFGPIFLVVIHSKSIWTNMIREGNNQFIFIMTWILKASSPPALRNFLTLLFTRIFWTKIGRDVFSYKYFWKNKIVAGLSKFSYHMKWKFYFVFTLKSEIEGAPGKSAQA